MQITTNLEGLERIKVAMNDAGFELRTGRFPRSGVKMSDKLKNAIWWIANHRGEEWPLERFTQYLNGPMGKTVLDQLDEGESFILQTAEHTLKITKVKGRAVVTIP